MTAGGIVDEFLTLKEGTDADVLAMQCGDFYEFFADDAELVAEELDLAVSQKSSHGESYPMAGVPVDELTPYVSALVERGYRVAVADQYETDDGHAREVTRVVTPGTLLETTDEAAQYLAAVVRGDEGGYGLAVADVTTGDFHATAVDPGASDGEGREVADGGSEALTAENAGGSADGDTSDASSGERAGASRGEARNSSGGGSVGGGAAAALTELYKFDPAEVLPGPRLREDDEFLAAVRERTDATLSLHETEAFAPGKARHRVREQFGAETLESVGVADRDAAVRAAGAVLSYVETTGVGTLAAVTRLHAYGTGDHVALDATTQRNLELTETMQGETAGSLFATIDHTVTAAGGRRLREWLQRPRRDRAELDRRQTSVAALAEAALARDRVRDALADVYDLERLATRAVAGSADARDLRSVQATLERFERVATVLAESEALSESPLQDRLAAVDRDAVAELAATIDEALVDDPPGTVTQGNVMAPSWDDELAAVVAEHEDALDWIETLPEREQERTGITHLSVDRNTTDGYYIQVGNSETDQVPEEYENIKSLKNHERFTTDELQERERDVLRLEEQRHDLEYELFEELRERIGDRADLLRSAGRALAAVDALASLAVHAVRNDWTRPQLTDGRELVVEAGRHPVVEQTTEFVPNDLAMDEERQFLLVTGPNMSGKSTYMRQAALVTLLAQVGSFVPARSARVGLVDGIYTRVGALDELAQGRSTFMVEMQELSNILHSATADSLVILDEVGRGTATYDGISIAWAATEYLHNEVRAKTLFATHYHELTSLADHLERVHNVHVAADETDGDVTFLRTVRDGPTDRSYGIHVADLAGVPGPVVDRARSVLADLREDRAVEARGAGGSEPVQAVFDVGAGEMVTRSGSDDADADVATGGEGGTGADDATDGSPSGAEGGTGADDATAGSPTGADERVAAADPDANEILAELRELSLAETPPVELMERMRAWQERLD